MNKTQKYITDIYPLSYIIRYSNVPRIKDESVAEHSFYVAAIVQKLFDEYKFKLGIALNMAISHDIIEVYVNDIPHLIKKRYPDLAKMLKDIEKKEASGFPKSVGYGIKGLHSNSTESKIVHMADAMQCEQYALNEISLGNSGYMESVVEHSIKRVDQIRQEIVIYKRENAL